MWSLKVKPLKINRMYKNMFRYNDEKQANKKITTITKLMFSQGL